MMELNHEVPLYENVPQTNSIAGNYDEGSCDSSYYLHALLSWRWSRDVIGRHVAVLTQSHTILVLLLEYRCQIEMAPRLRLDDL